MISFRKLQIDQIKDYLYHSCIHDSLLKDARYNLVKGCLELTLYSPYNCYFYKLSFQDILEMQFVKCFDYCYCDSETINTLIVDDNGMRFRNTEVSDSKIISDYIFFTLEMLSGDILNIVSKEISIEEHKGTVPLC